MFLVRHLSKCYDNGLTKTEALRDLSLEIGKEIIAIVGASGSGKTTLLNIMSTIDRNFEGELLFGDINLREISEKEAASLRLKEFGFVFQKYELIPTLNCHDNIMLPSVFGKKEPESGLFEKVIRALELEEQLKKMPDELSGGQQQRVAIARAIMGSPQVVFADEPTGNLDKANGERVIELLISCAREFSQTLIYVTHNEALAEQADRIIKIEDGAVVDG